MKFGPNCDWKPIFSQFGSCLTMRPGLRRSDRRSELALPGELRRPGRVAKRLPNGLKLGLQSWFGPNFTVEFEVFFRKKLAWPNVRAP